MSENTISQISTKGSTGFIMDALNNPNVTSEQQEKMNEVMMDNAISNVNNPANAIRIPKKVRTQVRTDNRVGRNDKCPCGSGKKFKHCCMGNGQYDATYVEVNKRR